MHRPLTAILNKALKFQLKEIQNQTGKYISVYFSVSFIAIPNS